jgi:hypothetical protein
MEAVMSNTTTNILALVALFFLWGLAGHFDEADDPTRDSAGAQSKAITDAQQATPLLRMVCVAETELPAVVPSQARMPGHARLVTFPAQPNDEGPARTTVLRCAVDND